MAASLRAEKGCLFNGHRVHRPFRPRTIPIEVRQFMFHVRLGNIVTRSRPVSELNVGGEDIRNFGLVIFGRGTALKSTIRVLLLSLRIKGLQVSKSGHVNGLRRVDRHICGAILASGSVATNANLGPAITVTTGRGDDPQDVIGRIVLSSDLTQNARREATYAIVASRVTKGRGFEDPYRILCSRAALFVGCLICQFLGHGRRLSHTFNLFFIVEASEGSLVLFSSRFRHVQASGLRLVAQTSPLRSPQLAVRVTTRRNAIIRPFRRFRVDTVCVSNVVRRPLVRPITERGLALAAKGVNHVYLHNGVAQVNVPFRACTGFLGYGVFAGLYRRSRTFHVVCLRVLGHYVSVVKGRCAKYEASPTARNRRYPQR